MNKYKLVCKLTNIHTDAVTNTQKYSGLSVHQQAQGEHKSEYWVVLPRSG